MDKQAFLIEIEEKNLFWSYARGAINDLHDDVIIETILLYGSVEDIIHLFRLYNNNAIRKVWQSNIIPDKRYDHLNYYLAKVFFNISDPAKYFRKFYKNNRYERIKKIVATNRIGF